MPGKIVYTPPIKTQHDRNGCEGKPDPKTVPEGSVWQCGDCAQKWVVDTGTQYNETWYSWIRLKPTPRNSWSDR